MPVEQLTLTEAQQAIANLWGTDWQTMAASMSEYGLTPAQMASNEFLYTWSDGAVTPIYAKNGETVLGYNFRATPQTARIGTAGNSNAQIIARGTVNHAPATTIETVGVNAGKVKVSRLAGVGTKVATAASKLAVPLTIASIGITLGKTIDETLYNFNPDFWDSIGLSTLNPQTWSELVGGNDTIQGQFFNAIFGIDPQTGETQAYIDSEAFAYSAYCMAQSHMFDPSTDTVPSYNPQSADWNLGNLAGRIIFPFSFTPSNTATQTYTGNTWRTWTATTEGNIYVCDVEYLDSRNRLNHNSVPLFVSDSPMTIAWHASNGNTGTISVLSINLSGHTYYYGGGGSSFLAEQLVSTTCVINPCNNGIPVLTDVVKLAFNGDMVHGSTIPGIGDQTGAILPDISNWSDPASTLAALQQQYPQMFQNGIDYPVVQPDGTVVNHKYIPITLPDTSSTTTTQPVSGNQTQTQPSVDPATATQTLIDLITKVLQQPMTEPVTDTPNPPQNPTDTGDGSSPVPTVPVGSASALWKIYHPTQAQIDSFGGWLWSSNFIDQILKIFNNPMEAVIGLHKVYATPIDAGTTTIKVGYLDSNVPSAYIDQQYINVSCGSINLYEQFGNVFDYAPFTDIQIYLPFVGIVPLNVADVMRSTISVDYGVDVITGACLAMVEVSRDGNSSVLYQYSGNCAVQYPISSGSYMGIVSSIISVAGGVAATVASGGAAAPLALGAAGGLLNAHTSVQHSGGFSGNAGAMGGKIPYLIITRPQTKVAYDAESMQGFPTNEYVSIGQCSGYIKADVAHIINVNATDEELTEINNLLLSGIII